MVLPFQHIPNNERMPLFFAEVNNSQANTGGTTQRALMIGQILSTGQAVPNTPVRCQGLNDAIAQGGAGSMLHLMTQAFLANNPFFEVWYLPLADATGSAAASTTLTFLTSPTAQGSIALYVAGQSVPVLVSASETVTAIATAVAAAINAMPNLPVTATSAAGVVTITAKNKGLCGNDIDIRFNYMGVQNGEATPLGLTYSCTGTVDGSGWLLTGGLVNPVLSTALSNLGSQTYDYIASPYTDGTSTAALTSFLNDSTGRWSWESQIYGHNFIAYRGTMGAVQTYGLTMNDQHTSCMGFYDSPTPNWVWAAAITGAASSSASVDPAMPMHTVPIYGVQAPPLLSQFNGTGQNSLLWSGISTFNVNVSGQCSIQDMITTYQTNSSGVADNSYLQVETLFTLMYVLRFLQAVVTSKYARVKLASNGTAFAPGSGIVTPNTVKSDIIAGYSQLVWNGICQNAAAFAANLIVEQNSTNPNRLDVLYPADLIDQLDVFATLLQFRLM